MKRILASLFMAVLLVLALAYLGRNAIAREVLTLGVPRQTGFPLEVGAVRLGLLSGRLDVEDLKLSNPPGFKEHLFVDVPSLRAQYDTASILRRRPHIRTLEVEVREVRVVTNEKGERNSTRLLDAASSGGATPSHPWRYHVDLLRIHIGTVVIEDESRGQHRERTIALNADITYRDLSESTGLAGLVASSALKQLGPAIGDVAKGMGEALKGAGQGIGKKHRSLLDLLKRKL